MVDVLLRPPKMSYTDKRDGLLESFVKILMFRFGSDAKYK